MPGFALGPVPQDLAGLCVIRVVEQDFMQGLKAGGCLFLITQLLRQFEQAIGVILEQGLQFCLARQVNLFLWREDVEPLRIPLKNPGPGRFA